MLTPEQTKQRLQKIKQVKIDEKMKQDKITKYNHENENMIAFGLALLSLSMMPKIKKKWYQF